MVSGDWEVSRPILKSFSMTSRKGVTSVDIVSLIGNT